MTERLLSGQAHPAGQYISPTTPGASANLPPIPYDPDLAKRPMKEAGWENGFSVVLTGSNDRYPSDAQVTQAVGQMLTRTLDDTRRHALYARAAEIAADDMGVVPVYFTVNTWATKKGLTYEARGDEQSFAMSLRPAQ